MQLEAGRKAADVARELGVLKHTIYAWKAKYGGLDVNEAQQHTREKRSNPIWFLPCDDLEWIVGNVAVRLIRNPGARQHFVSRSTSGQFDGRLSADVKEAESLEITGTPTVFINGHRKEGAMSTSALAKEIKTQSGDLN